MSEHCYPQRALMADYARAGAGAALTVGPLFTVPASTTVSVVLAGLGLLFVAFAGRTWLRQGTCVRMDEKGIATGAQGAKRIAWGDIASLELRYYATRRDRARGWMQMTVSGSGATLRLESTLDGFEFIARGAARAAQHNGVALAPTTVENLRALGIVPDRAVEGPEEKRAARAEPT